MAIAGNFQLSPDRYRERGYSLLPGGPGVAVRRGRCEQLAHLRQGGPHHARARQHGAGCARSVRPLLAGRSAGDLVEADALHLSRRDLGYVGFVQADYEPVQGLHLGRREKRWTSVTRSGPGDLLGIDQPPRPGAGEPRFGGWLTADWFFLPHCELRIDAIVRQDDPFTLLSQLHVFL